MHLPGRCRCGPLKVYDNPQAAQLKASRNYGCMLSPNAGATNEPDAWLSQIYRTGGSRNYSNYSDAAVDSMIDRQRTIFDIAERKARVRDIILYLIDNRPDTRPVWRFLLNGVRPQIREYSPEVLMSGTQYKRVWLDT